MASIPNALQEEIFSGNFLDIRSSAVFILFISVGAGFMLCALSLSLLRNISESAQGYAATLGPALRSSALSSAAY